MSAETTTTPEAGYIIGVGVLAFVIIWVLAFLADTFRNRDMHISQYKFPGAIRYAKYDKETRKYTNSLYANYDIHKQGSMLFLYVPLIFFFLIMLCGFMNEWSSDYPNKGTTEMCLWWMILSLIALVVLICSSRVNNNFRDYVEYPYDLKEMIHCLYCGTWNYYGAQNCKSCGSPISYKEYDTNNDDIIDEKD